MLHITITDLETNEICLDEDCEAIVGGIGLGGGISGIKNSRGICAVNGRTGSVAAAHLAAADTMRKSLEMHEDVAALIKLVGGTECLREARREVK